MEDLNDKVTGGTLSASEWDQPMSEIQNPIEASGQVLSGTDLHQLEKSIQAYASAGTWYTEVGAADAYACNPVGLKVGIRALDAAHDGALVRFRPTNANTGASTINVNGLGAKAIVREDYTALAAGDLVTNRDAMVRWRYSGDHFVLATFVISATQSVPSGQINGIITSNATDTDHDIQFGTGICRDSSDVDTILMPSAIIKQIDVTPWLAGTNQGGFPSGITLSADTWYHLFVIKNPTTGAVDAGFDSSLVAANLLSDATGYTLYRRVGSVRTDGSLNIIQYIQHGDQFRWLPQSFQDVSISNPGTGEVTHTLDYVPPGLRVEADVSIVVVQDLGTGLVFYVVGGGEETLAAATGSNVDMITVLEASTMALGMRLLTNTSKQIKTRQSASNGSSAIDIQVHGWIDLRGKE